MRVEPGAAASGHSITAGRMGSEVRSAPGVPGLEGGSWPVLTALRQAQGLTAAGARRAAGAGGGSGAQPIAQASGLVVAEPCLRQRLPRL